jgi:hypothetical protein
MNFKEYLDILGVAIDSFNSIVGLCGAIIIPFTLALIALLWPDIQKRNRRESFMDLILRELEEIDPYPKFPDPKKGDWWKHQKKQFIHRKIFKEASENRDFILSLDPEIVYFVSQLWQSLEDHEWSNWDHFLKCLSSPKYDKNKKIGTARKRWITLYEGYQQMKRTSY